MHRILSHVLINSRRILIVVEPEVVHCPEEANTVVVTIDVEGTNPEAGKQLRPTQDG